MRNRTAVALALIAGLVYTSLLFNSAPASAQNSTNTSAVTDKRVTMSMENADIRTALKVLFKTAGVSYALDPQVQGSVTVSLQDIPFQTALETILRNAGSTVPLVCRVENSVWVVAPKVEVKEPAPTRETDTEEQTTPRVRVEKITLNYADPYDVVAALNAGLLQDRSVQVFPVPGGIGAIGRLGGYGSGGFGSNGFGGGFGGGGVGGGFGSNGFGSGGPGGFGSNGFGSGGFGGYRGGNFGGLNGGGWGGGYGNNGLGGGFGGGRR